MNRIIVKYIFILVVLVTGEIFSAERTTKVQYITPDQIYLDAGRNMGIEKGNKGKIYRNGELLADIEIIFIADKTSSCKILKKYDNLQIGDLAVIEINEQELDTVENVTSESIAYEAEQPSVTFKPEKKKSKTISGRVGLQFYAQDNLDEYNYDYYQPSLSLNLAFNDILGEYYDLRLKMRSRRNMKKIDGISENEWDNRIYNFALNYNNPESRFNFGLGRIISNNISGMGYIDGGVFSYKIEDRINLGFFAGTQPDLQNSRIQYDETKGGIYANYRYRDFNSSFLSATIAIAGQYVNGQIDREFIYQQINYSLSSKLYLYQSSEISVNRGWRKEAAGSDLQLSNLLLSARYNFTRNIGLSLGYDNRQNVYTYYTKTTPDTLFDDDLRQGYRAGVSFKLPMDIRLAFNGNYRTQENSDETSLYYSAGVSFNDFLQTNSFLNYRIAVYDNQYTSGMQNSIGISRYFVRRLNLGVTIGQNLYTYSLYNQDLTDNWLRFNGSYYFNRTFYASGSLEIFRGDNTNSNRIYIDFGVRL